MIRSFVMKSGIETDLVLRNAEELLEKNLTLVLENKKSSRNIVLTVNYDGSDFIIKAGLDAETDYLALDILSRIGFLSPKVVSYSNYHVAGIDYGIIIMTKLCGVQVRSLPSKERSSVVSAIIDELEKLKVCRSEGLAGNIKSIENRSGLTWKAYLERIIDEAKIDLETSNPMSTILVNWESVLLAIETVRSGIARLPDKLELNLLHNDLNLANCIAIDGRLVGIVDWSDAIYGEYLYDVARLRMNLEQSKDEKALEVYRLKVRMSPEKNRREELYYLCRLIEYLGIYKKYGDDHWFYRNQQLLLDAITEPSNYHQFR